MNWINIKKILVDAASKRSLCVGVIMSMPEHEGRDTYEAAAARA